VDDVLRRQASDIHRQIFWLHYRQGMTAKEIAGLAYLGLSEKGVESVLFRLVRLVREEFAGRSRQPAPLRCQAHGRTAAASRRAHAR
jgi:hypothetical protein